MMFTSNKQHILQMLETIRSEKIEHKQNKKVQNSAYYITTIIEY
jgi:hypothetical protein